MSFTIWCNTRLISPGRERLATGVEPHKLILSANASASVLTAGTNDPRLAEADIAFGQPAVEDCFRHSQLRWIELSSAGYTRYDSDDLIEALRSRGTILTNASSVFANSCAQHVLAMMLGLGRQLPQSLRDQLTDQ